MNYYSDESEWKWLIKNAIDWDKIIPLYYKSFPTADGFNNKEELLGFFDEMLTATGEWSGETLTPRAVELDKQGAGTVKDGVTIPGELLQKSYDEAKELALIGLCAEPEFGGMGVPLIVGMLAFSQMNRACIATATQLGFYTSIIDMIERFCTHEEKERLIPQIVSGELSGSMCLTEPGCGSDLGSLKTSAEKREDGKYTINGSKIFITNGGGGLGFVLARIKGAPTGLEGISLFLVEQFIDGDRSNLNYKIAKNEEKMGLHGSFTCEVVYENSVGTLVGEEHKGFQYMLHLMNEARVSVGLQSLGGMEACLHYAKEYAKERTQFGKSLLDLPLYKRNFDEWETERDAFRALMVDTLSAFDIYQKLDMKQRHSNDLSEDELKLFKEAKKKVRRRTPLVKYYGTETFTLLSQRAIQALGGYGFITEYQAERWHRDSFAPLLYEGTSQIQALMALKDLMKYIMKNPTKFFQSMVYSHPFGGLFNSQSEHQRKFQTIQYEFKKALSALLVKTLRPDVDLNDLSEMLKLFDAKNWVTEDKFNLLMTHAETICQSMAYMENYRVLVEHTSIDESRGDLADRYEKLIRPRLEAIYTDWKLS